MLPQSQSRSLLGRIGRFMLNRHMVHLVLMAAVVLGIIGGVCGSLCRFS